MLALLLTLVFWSSPHPVLYVCMPGHGPVGSPPSTCEQLHFAVLAKFPAPRLGP